MNEMDPLEFVRLLKDNAESKSQMAFFLGAGCSISSGIPAAGGLVETWLKQLHYRKTGGKGDFKQWLEEAGYDAGNLAASYAEVMRETFPQTVRQRAEVENFVGGKDPLFGYSALAALVTHELYADNFNLILTTNFDDLVADALYLYTRQKPLVIAHESLAGFAATVLNRPLVIKLHGDALLDPKSLEEETGELDRGLEKVLAEQLRRRGLIFLGYGGNDRGIARSLSRLPDDALAWGIFWVNETIPDTEFGTWLRSRPDVHWVKHRDFDELMLIIFQEFELEHPKRERFDLLLKDRRETFKKLTKQVDNLEQGAWKQALTSAVKATRSRFDGWEEAELKAAEVEDSDPDEANRIYRRGLEQFPSSAELLGDYARFLSEVRNAHDEAEELYIRAIELKPTDALNLGNYAVFLENERKDEDQAEDLYKRALDADPLHANNLRNYALFLARVRHDEEGAEALYKNAHEEDPFDADVLGNYAVFLETVRRDMDEAERIYGAALVADSDHPFTLASYADFLANVRKDDNRAEELYEHALEVDPDDANTLGSYAIFVENARSDPERAEELYERALEANPRHADSLGNYALFLENVRKDPERAEELYERALEADPRHANTLGSYAYFLETVRKDPKRAEEFYERALEADPDHANNLANYARRLLAQGRDETGLQLLGRALARVDRDQTDIRLECHFYRLAHAAEEERPDAVRQIADLVAAGARSPGWDLSPNVERVEADEPDRAPFLRTLASVISEEEDPETLDEFPEWQAATG